MIHYKLSRGAKIPFVGINPHLGWVFSERRAVVKQQDVFVPCSTARDSCKKQEVT